LSCFQSFPQNISSLDISFIVQQFFDQQNMFKYLLTAFILVKFHQETKQKWQSIDNNYIYYGIYVHKHFVEDNILITQIKNKQTYNRIPR